MDNLTKPRYIKRVRDIMLPLSKYSVVLHDATLKQVVLHLKNAYCDSRERGCSRAGPRIVFVVDEEGNLLGIIDLKTVLKVLIPEITGKVGDKLSIQAMSIAFAEADASYYDETKSAFLARVQRNSEKRVSDIMKKITFTIQAEQDIFEAFSIFINNDVESIAVYEGKKLMGVLRDRDLFVLLSDLLA